jgi:hypothetical protein
MPFVIDWYIPYRVIDVRLWGEVSGDEIRQLATHFVDMLTQVQIHMPDKKPYLLYDTLEALSMPPLYLMLKEAAPVLRFKNRGPMFHITQNQAIRSIAEITAHVTQFQLLLFETRAEALRALQVALAKDDFYIPQR